MSIMDGEISTGLMGEELSLVTLVSQVSWVPQVSSLAGPSGVPGAWGVTGEAGIPGVPGVPGAAGVTDDGGMSIMDGEITTGLTGEELSLVTLVS